MMQSKQRLFVMAAALALALSLVARTAAAQTGGTTPAQPMERPVRFGLHAGLNMATLGGDDVDDSVIKARQGVQVGALLSIQLGPNVALQPEVAYSMKGSGIKGSPSGTISLDYVHVPLLLMGLIPVAPTVRLRLGGGPGMGILVAAKAKGGGQTTDIKDNTKPLDFGLLFCGGVEVLLANGGALQFDARYDLGLLTVDDTASEADIKNRVFSLTAGYVF